jgi:hypothetical protein
VLQRKVRGRVQFTNSDCLFSVQLYRWCPSVLKAVTIIRLKASCAGIVPVSPLLALEIALPRRPAAHGVAHMRGTNRSPFFWHSAMGAAR